MFFKFQYSCKLLCPWLFSLRFLMKAKPYNNPKQRPGKESSRNVEICQKTRSKVYILGHVPRTDARNHSNVISWAWFHPTNMMDGSYFLLNCSLLLVKKMPIESAVAKPSGLTIIWRNNTVFFTRNPNSKILQFKHWAYHAYLYQKMWVKFFWCIHRDFVLRTSVMFTWVGSIFFWIKGQCCSGSNYK